MPTINMSALWVERIKSAAGKIDWFDEKVTGLGLRVSHTGVKTWFILYRIKGDPSRKKHRLTLGQYPALPLAAARRAAGEKLLAVERGQDPAGERRTTKAAPTFAELAVEYLDKHAKKTKRSWAEDLRLLRPVLPVDYLAAHTPSRKSTQSKPAATAILAAWAPRKAHSITRREMIALLDDVADTAPIMANRLFALLRKLFNFAVSRDILEHTPCIGVRAPAPEQAGERVLTDGEIPGVWRLLESGEGLAMSDTMRLALRLILVTGQRPNEVLGLPEAEIIDDWWNLPVERAKNKLAHRVPLGPMAQGILQQARALTAGREKFKHMTCRYLFPSPRGDRPMSESAASHAVRNNIQSFGIPPFTPHDLRRTVSTHLAQLACAEEVIDAVLNHKRSGVTRKHYNLYRYDAEKRAALLAWERKLQALINGTSGKVLPFARDEA